ncbi:carbohydrate ABC transporter permease [Paenibacillus sp. S150]|uniref:carbohydrate ABC transporter permease n=1 Tax=Paenibacillus sp. S150 TaxID=2749826 RepID=UPI001C585AC2|nr:carbohydrate ABC transporter permease [Paenibacillus sp. S150]MBW4082223.1 carbohydrate ABC transporter permease [Paenibacillus sp. S150]
MQLNSQTAAAAGTAPIRRRNLVPGLLKNLFLWGYAVITIGLFVWVTMTAFKENREIFASPFGLPTDYRFDNFVDAWNKGNMSQYFWNSLFVSIFTVLLCIALSSTLSYVLARFRFKGNTAIYALFVLGVAIPLQSLLLPIFFRMDDIGLRDTLAGLVIVNAALNLPKAVFMLVGFMQGIPKEVEESAIIDGCGYGGIFSRIILPMSKPGLATAGILVFISVWNEYVFSTVLVSSNAVKTLPLGLASFQTSFISDYGLISAGVVLSIIPVLLVYVLMQEQIIKGMTDGAVKG